MKKKDRKKYDEDGKAVVEYIVPKYDKYVLLATKTPVAVLRYLIFHSFCIPRVAENRSFFLYY